MIWSVVATCADNLCRRPTWVEDDGDRNVVVRGYSILDSMLIGIIMVGVIALMLAVLA